jgi:DnaK suppressor protein
MEARPWRDLDDRRRRVDDLVSGIRNPGSAREKTEWLPLRSNSLRLVKAPHGMLECGVRAMNIQEYKRRLLELEKSLSASTARKRESAREQVFDSAGDVGDDSLADEGESEAFTEAELDATVLQQVRDALRRIDDGTFGRCVIDGAPIEPKRLDAMPWTPYCLKHQQLLEAAARPKMPTL